MCPNMALVINFKPDFCSSRMKLCHFQDVNMNNFENKQQFQKKVMLIPMVEIKSQFTNEFLNLTLYPTMISTIVIGVVLNARIRLGCSQDVQCM